MIRTLFSLIKSLKIHCLLCSVCVYMCVCVCVCVCVLKENLLSLKAFHTPTHYISVHCTHSSKIAKGKDTSTEDQIRSFRLIQCSVISSVGGCIHRQYKACKAVTATVSCPNRDLCWWLVLLMLVTWWETALFDTLGAIAETWELV